jgi:surface protein
MDVGQVITAGTIAPAGSTVTYQWQRADTEGGSYADIGGATNSTYTIVEADESKWLRCSVTGTGAYEGTVNSASSQVSLMFRATFKTDNLSTGSSTNVQVKLPLINGGTYNMKVYWGDGSSDLITAYNQAAVTHTYGAIGSYDVSIAGTCRGFKFNATGDRLKILNIKAWGTKWRPNSTTDASNTFNGCNNMVGSYTDIMNVTDATEFTNFFQNCAVFNSPVTNMISSNVTDIRNMFDLCSAFNQSVSTWDTSNVTKTNSLFRYSSGFNQEVSTFNTSNMTDMSSMFNNATSFNKSVSNFNTSKVTTMYYMFNGSTSFAQSVATFSIVALTTAQNMLSSAPAFGRTNYDALLIAWEAQVENPNVPFSAGTTKYSAGAAATARAALVSSGWSVTDGGQF